MIYDVYIQGDLIAETDSIDLVKVFIRENPGCSVKEALSGKEFTIECAKKTSPKSQAIAAGGHTFPAGGHPFPAGGHTFPVTER
jgi:hypothetical protein